MAGDASPAASLLDAEQLADVGERFQRYLAAIKHQGAIDKTQAGFIALAARCAWLCRQNSAPDPLEDREDFSSQHNQVSASMQGPVPARLASSDERCYVRKPAPWCFGHERELFRCWYMIAKLYTKFLVLALCLNSSCRARRLLQERGPALHGLPARWLAQLLGRAGAAGQSRDDILRRSAGLPAAIVALFLAEPANQARKVCGTTKP